MADVDICRSSRSAALRKHLTRAQSLRPATGSCAFSHSTIPITSDSSHSETSREVVFAPILSALELRPTQTLTEKRHQLSLVHYTGRKLSSRRILIQSYGLLIRSWST